MLCSVPPFFSIRCPFPMSPVFPFPPLRRKSGLGLVHCGTTFFFFFSVPFRPRFGHSVFKNGDHLLICSGRFPMWAVTQCRGVPSLPHVLILFKPEGFGSGLLRADLLFFFHFFRLCQPSSKGFHSLPPPPSFPPHLCRPCSFRWQFPPPF